MFTSTRPVTSIPSRHTTPRRFVKSLERCLETLLQTLPQDDVVIEDLVIRGDRVEVKYRNQGKLAGSPSQTVSVNCVDVLRLDNGRVMEHWDTVYQVKA